MSIQQYIKQVIDEFIKAEPKEVTGNRYIDFDIGVDVTEKGIEVEQGSNNRIKFTLEVKRS